MRSNKPLAFLLRPTTINAIVGQEKVLSQAGLIRRMVDQQFATSLIFYGPPGTGKTSFALALAQDLNLDYNLFNASYDKKEKLSQIIAQAQTKKQILVIDEIHRMNKDKQDLLLEHMENGNLIVFFTTTENPFFVINPAIRSRATIVKVEPIQSEEMFHFLQKLITEQKIKLNISDEALNYLCQVAAGDLRSAINYLELFLNLYAEQKIDLTFVSQIIPNAQVKGAKYGDDLHDLKSALQKSVRGSDVDASLYYFARLMAIGDYETLMRRMMVMSYEDIGLANPQVPVHVVTACDAFRQLGMPEGIIPLGLAVVEMALSEKSNSAYLATNQAFTDIQSGLIYDVPDLLKDTHYKSAIKFGYGKGYQYPHNFPNDWVNQIYLPKEIKNVHYYQPKNHSVYEKRIWDLYQKMKNK